MKLTYRPEIDGLRAIAVAAVILYHAQITFFGHNFFKGGFIGVDIFFVISGYLITSLILKELKVTGNFSFLHFYERLARRILPALFVVMLVPLPFAWMYLLPSSFIDYSKSILYSLGFSSNFYFHYSGLQYGTEDSLLRPFLHTWSLSVEEQFYIVFPIVLLFTFKYFKKYLLHILILGFIISLIIAHWGAYNHPLFNFYILPTRGWELIAGSILAYLEINRGGRSYHKLLNQTLPILGLFLIVHSIFFYNNKTFHPSFYTLSPIIGVCLIIWFSNKDDLIAKLLSSKLFVGTGLISYSLYLWHYPLFAFARIKDDTPSQYDKFEWIVLTIILSIITYFLVERIFRNKKYFLAKTFLKLLGIIILLIFFSNLLVIYKQGFKDRFYTAVYKFPTSNIFYTLTQDDERCFERVKNFCSFNDSFSKKIYLIGDSHLGSLMNDLKNKLDDKNYNFIPITYPGFFPFTNLVRVNEKTKQINKKVLILRNEVNNILRNSRNNIVVLGGVTPLYFYNKRFFDNGKFVKEMPLLQDLWDQIYVNKDDLNFSSKSLENEFKDLIFRVSKNNKVIIVYPIPEIGFNLPKKLNSTIFLKQKISKDKYLYKFDYLKYIAVNKEIIKIYDDLNFSNVYRIRPQNLFCNTLFKNKCITHDESNIFFEDRWHPSPKGAEMINDLLMKEIEKIEAAQ